MKTMRLDTLWKKVRAWAKANGKEQNEHLVVGMWPF